MEEIHNKRFPGESDAYRAARNALLMEEMALRKKIEAVAQFRRKLPLGGKVQEDYVFAEGANDLEDTTSQKKTTLSELFVPGKASLIIYSFMFSPDDELPCPMCNAILDGLNGNAQHIRQRTNFAVVAKVPIEKIRTWARQRGWMNLQLLSSVNNNYNRDYFAEDPEFGQMPSIIVFTKQDDGIYHYYNTELLYVPTEPDQHPRHADMIWPLWNMFDLTPEGRGMGWMPQFSYD